MGIGAQTDHPSFKGDLKFVREQMQGIHQALVKENEYEIIVNLSSQVLEKISTDYIDQGYPSGRPERPFLVNLYAGAYLLNYMAEKGIEIISGLTEVKVPLHEARYRPDLPIVP